MSHYLRCIRLASEYPDYDILFASSAKYNKFVLDAGYGVFEVEGFNADYVMNCAREFDFSWLNKKDIEKVFLSQRDALLKLKPDLIIGDTWPTLKMAAEATGTPCVALMNAYMCKYYTETRPLSRNHPGFKHLQKLPLQARNRIINLAENISFRIVHKPFRQLRRKYSLKKINNYLMEMEGDENLICDDVNIFPLKPLPSNYRIVGPLTFDPVDEDTELLQSLDPLKPSICVCMGSTGNWKELRFLSELKYTKFNIITAGDENELIKGPHIFRKKFINLDQVLPHCKYLICHGGNGTIYKGLQHRVFMFFVTSHFEQEWNAERLEVLGLGKRFDSESAEWLCSENRELSALNS